jgi:poly-gamma-glutamate capsule biosynthesis protein CapA/YwtB (metallophosphatase superfamily)
MKKVTKAIILILGLSFGFLISYYIDNENKQFNGPINTHHEYEIDLIMVGDALIHGAVYADAFDGNKYDFTKMFTYIKPIIQEYDLAFYNQETIIGGKSLGLSTYSRFNSPEEIGDAMVAMGFNLVSLANNHTLDRGEKAIINSYNYWREKDVMTAGSYINEEQRQAINIKEKNNITYTLLAYTTNTNGLKPTKPYHVNIYDKEKVKEDIQRVRDKVDLLLVSMHWGTEYTHTPTKEQKEIASYLASLEVDIVIGHHPHVIQPIKTINNTLVIYSLGNFISAQKGIERLVGMMVSVNIKKEVDGEITKMHYDDVTAHLIYTYRNQSIKNFKVIPFTDLTDTILPNYRKHYAKYSSIITDYDDTIMVIDIMN